MFEVKKHPCFDFLTGNDKTRKEVKKLENGKLYGGDWLNGKRHGKIVRSISLLSGKGILWMPNGNVYEGDWANDNYHGKFGRD